MVPIRVRGEGEFRELLTCSFVPGEAEDNTGLGYGAGNGNMKEKTEVREAGNENMLRTYLSSKFQEQKINIPVMMQSFQLE